MHIGLIELGGLIWSGVLKLCFLWPLSHLRSTCLHSGWAAGFLSTSSNHNPGEQRELCVCVCVCVYVCVCPVSVSRPVCWEWIHYWNSLSLLSGRIPLSAQMNLLYVYFVCKASIWLGWQVSLTRFGERCVRCVLQLWHCLTPAAFECSFKACLVECFSPHILAPFTNPPPTSSSSSSSSSCSSCSSPPALHCVFPVHFLPSCPSHLAVSSILLHTVSSNNALLPVIDGAWLNFDLSMDRSARDQWSQWWKTEIWRQRKQSGIFCVRTEQLYWPVCVSSASCLLLIHKSAHSSILDVASLFYNHSKWGGVFYDIWTLM